MQRSRQQCRPSEDRHRTRSRPNNLLATVFPNPISLDQAIAIHSRLSNGSSSAELEVEGRVRASFGAMNPISLRGKGMKYCSEVKLVYTQAGCCTIRMRQAQDATPPAFRECRRRSIRTVHFGTRPDRLVNHVDGFLGDRVEGCYCFRIGFECSLGDDQL